MCFWQSFNSDLKRFRFWEEQEMAFFIRYELRIHKKSVIVLALFDTNIIMFVSHWSIVLRLLGNDIQYTLELWTFVWIATSKYEQKLHFHAANHSETLRMFAFVAVWMHSGKCWCTAESRNILALWSLCLLNICTGVKQPVIFFCGVTIVGVLCHPRPCKADSHGLQGASANQSADCWVLPSLIMPSIVLTLWTVYW